MNQSTDKDLLSSFCGTSSVPGDKGQQPDSCVAALGDQSVMVLLVFSVEPTQAC